MQLIRGNFFTDCGDEGNPTRWVVRAGAEEQAPGEPFEGASNMPSVSEMKPGGFYDDHSSPERSSIEMLLPWVDHAAQSVSLPGDGTSIGIADYGCSEVRNSILVIGPAADVLRRLRASIQRTDPPPRAQTDVERRGSFKTEFGCHCRPGTLWVRQCGPEKTLPGKLAVAHAGYRSVFRNYRYSFMLATSADSPNRTIPSSTVPTAPMPVHTA